MCNCITQKQIIEKWAGGIAHNKELKKAIENPMTKLTKKTYHAVLKILFDYNVERLSFGVRIAIDEIILKEGLSSLMEDTLNSFNFEEDEWQKQANNETQILTAISNKIIVELEKDFSIKRFSGLNFVFHVLSTDLEQKPLKLHNCKSGKAS
jgi:hypothetical protein